MIECQREEVVIGEALAGELVGRTEHASGGHIARFCHPGLGVIDRDRRVDGLDPVQGVRNKPGRRRPRIERGVPLVNDAGHG